MNQTPMDSLELAEGFVAEQIGRRQTHDGETVEVRGLMDNCDCVPFHIVSEAPGEPHGQWTLEECRWRGGGFATLSLPVLVAIYRFKKGTMNGFNQDTAELFYRREADQADAFDRMAHASRILGTPSPQFEGVVNLNDPYQAAAYINQVTPDSERTTMSLTASRSSSGTDFTPAPMGTHLARCCQVIDLGTQFSEHYQKSAHKVLIGWELPTEMDGDEPYLVWNRYTCSLHEKSRLYQDLNAWRGRQFTDEELDAFDLKDIIGAPCMVTVTHNTKNTAAGERTYANVTAVTAVLKGVKVPAAFHETKVYDIDDHDEVVFQSFSDYLKDTIRKSEERTGPRHPQHDSAVDSQDTDEAIVEDDVPF